VFSAASGCWLSVGIIQIEIGIVIGIERIYHSVQEEHSAYGFDFDPDSDFDPEESLKIVFTKDLYTPENKITVAEE
jgi:hypothetical protein